MKAWAELRLQLSAGQRNWWLVTGAAVVLAVSLV